MSSTTQTILALALVAVAVGFLLRSWFGKRKTPGCAGNCGAVSPEVKKLRARLRS